MIGTFVFGSCVSRDTYEFLPRDRFTLHTYVARQSLISAMSRPRPDPFPPTPALGQFQRRSLETDWSSGLMKLLAPRLSGLDLLLWDLCDERLGVYEFPDGSYCTRSVELMKSGLEESLTTGAQLHRFGTDRHLELWTASMQAFLDELSAHPVRVVLIALDWARATTDGRPTPSSYGLSADQANLIYPRYYQAVADTVAATPVSVHRVPVPQASVIGTRARLAHASRKLPLPGRLARRVAASTAQTPPADAEHRWGLAPFHYAPSVYDEVSSDIQALCTI